jgi:Uma2 family endonuclease
VSQSAEEPCLPSARHSARKPHGELGELFSEQTGFILRRRPDVVRCPDVAFVAAARLPGGVRDGALELAPDLAVEVLSPSNTAREMLRTLNDYLDGGAVLPGFSSPVAAMFAGLRAPDTPPTD